MSQIYKIFYLIYHLSIILFCVCFIFTICNVFFCISFHYVFYVTVFCDKLI